MTSVVGAASRLSPTITVRPSSRAELSMQPSITRVSNPAQYVETASAAGDTSYVTGALSQTTTSLTARLNVTFTPALSLQLYAQPFLSAGEYRSLGEVRDARARDIRAAGLDVRRGAPSRRAAMARSASTAVLAERRSRSTTLTSRCASSSRTPCCGGNTDPARRSFSCGRKPR